MARRSPAPPDDGARDGDPAHVDPTLEARLRRVGRELQEALRVALGSLAAGAARVRPVDLTDAGVDKSLASRLVRLTQQPDPLRALHAAPSPKGLAILAQRMRERPGGADGARAVEAARDALAALLADLGGRRADLLVALSAWIPEERERQERDARRAVQRGWTALAGARAGALYRAAFVEPAGDALACVVVQVDQDVRVLRPLERVFLAKLDGPAAVDADAARADRAFPRSLAGSGLHRGAPAPTLPELGSHPAPELRVTGRAGAAEVHVAPRSLDAATTTTVGLAWRTSLPRGDGALELDFDARALRPTEALVVDLFVHAALGSASSVTAVLETDSGSNRAAAAPAALPSRGAGFSSSHVRSVGAIVENVGREAGFDPSAFAGQRTRVRLPLPDERLVLRWNQATGDSRGEPRKRG
ncbi:MAG: hypothetical protein AAFP86_12920 [Planctomycetota bacterium]